jgi:hypothetical protein
MHLSAFHPTRRAVVVGVAAVGALVLASTVPTQASAQGPASTHVARLAANGAAHTTRIVVHRVGVTRVSQLSTSASRRQVPHKPLPVLLPHPPGSSGAAQIPTVRHPAQLAKGAGVRPDVSATVLKNFDGIDAVQNEATAFPLEPPDEGLGAGNGFVANFVNVTGGIYNPSGQMLDGPFFLNDFFGESADANTSDPRVFYDTSTDRWFATILEYQLGQAVEESHVDVAVSTSGDPTGTWKLYQIDTTNPAHFHCPCLADYPILGVDQHNIYISTNEFTSCLCEFNGAQLYAMSKPQLVAGQATVNTVFFENLAIAGSPAFHVQPANEYGPHGAEWALSSLDPNGTSDNRLGVWAVTNEAAVTSGVGMPLLSSRVLQSEGYAFPRNARNPKGFCQPCAGGAGLPTTGKVQTDWDAMQETQFMHGQLIGALNTGVNIPGETHARTGVAWFVVRPYLSDGRVDPATHVARQGYVAAHGLYMLYPHINMVLNGSMAMTFSIANRGTFLSAAYTVGRNKHDFNTTQIRLAAAGTNPDNGFTGTSQYENANRWGDYSNGQYVPGTNNVWLGTQYIPNAGGVYTNWGDRIFELQLSS